MTVLQSDRRFRTSSESVERSAYVIVGDTDAARTGAAVRECAELLPYRIVVSRDGDDLGRIVEEFGPPTLLIAALSLPGRSVLSIVERLLRADEELPVILWSGDRDLRELARSVLGARNVRLLRPSASTAALHACVEAVRQRHDATAADDGVPQEGLQDLAERARRRLGVEGAAVYGRCGDGPTYRVAVAWMPDTPMPNLPPLLPPAVEMAISSGDAMVWPDLASDGGLPHDATGTDVVRSLAVVPLIRDGRPAGALCVFDGKARTLSEGDLSVLAALSGGVLPTTRPSDDAPKPIDAQLADVVVRRELARARRERLSMSVVLFGAHGDGQAPVGVDAVSATVARAVRGNDLVMRWNESLVAVILTGVPTHVARQVAERVRMAVEVSAANATGVSGAVAELQPTDSFETAVTRASERLRLIVRGGQPRIA